MTRIGSMFSGVGGLDLAVHALFPDAEPAWFFEHDDAPSRVLAHHWPDVPNHRDVTAWDTVDPEPVDVLVGGFPCQDISHAGKGAGIKEGTRSGLWFQMADAIGALRPRLVLLENVAAITSNGGVAVVGSLAAMGYLGRAGVVRAADVGAPHGRARWFCVAYPHGEGPQGRAGVGDAEPASGAHEGSVAEGAAHVDAGAGLTLLPTPRASEQENRTTRRTPSQKRGEHGLYLSAEVQPAHWGEYAAAITRWEQVLGRPAPAPTDTKGRLSPAFTEWMMGWPDDWTEPAGSRAKRLKCCGNGVVPQQAIAAYTHLLGGVA